MISLSVRLVTVHCFADDPALYDVVLLRLVHQVLVLILQQTYSLVPVRLGDQHQHIAVVEVMLDEVAVIREPQTESRCIDTVVGAVTVEVPCQA